MKRFILLIIVVFFSCELFAKTIRVAVIDNGYHPENSKDLKLCKDVPNPINLTSIPVGVGSDHGQNIAHTIDHYAEDSDYCLFIIKGLPSPYIYIALWFVIEANMDIVNLSYGGKYKNNLEQFLVKKALDKNIAVMTAAGNDGDNLDKRCDYYPACTDSRIFVVGNGLSLKDRTENTNYGTVVDFWEDGEYVDFGGVMMSGTSQSTAIATGKMVKKLHNKYNK